MNPKSESQLHQTIAKSMQSLQITSNNTTSIYLTYLISFSRIYEILDDPSTNVENIIAQNSNNENAFHLLFKHKMLDILNSKEYIFPDAIAELHIDSNYQKHLRKPSKNKDNNNDYYGPISEDKIVSMNHYQVKGFFFTTRDDISETIIIHFGRYTMRLIDKFINNHNDNHNHDVTLCNALSVIDSNNKTALQYLIEKIDGIKNNSYRNEFIAGIKEKISYLLESQNVDIAQKVALLTTGESSVLYVLATSQYAGNWLDNDMIKRIISLPIPLESLKLVITSPKLSSLSIRTIIQEKFNIDLTGKSSAENAVENIKKFCQTMQPIPSKQSTLGILFLRSDFALEYLINITYLIIKHTTADNLSTILVDIKQTMATMKTIESIESIECENVALRNEHRPRIAVLEILTNATALITTTIQQHTTQDQIVAFLSSIDRLLKWHSGNINILLACKQPVVDSLMAFVLDFARDYSNIQSQMLSNLCIQVRNHIHTLLSNTELEANFILTLMENLINLTDNIKNPELKLRVFSHLFLEIEQGKNIVYLLFGHKKISLVELTRLIDKLTGISPIILPNKDSNNLLLLAMRKNLAIHNAIKASPSDYLEIAITIYNNSIEKNHDTFKQKIYGEHAINTIEFLIQERGTLWISYILDNTLDADSWQQLLLTSSIAPKLTAINNSNDKLAFFSSNKANTSTNATNNQIDKLVLPYQLLAIFKQYFISKSTKQPKEYNNRINHFKAMISYWLESTKELPCPPGRGSYKKLFDNIKIMEPIIAGDRRTVFEPLYNAAKEILEEYNLADQIDIEKVKEVEAIDIKDSNIDPSPLLTNLEIATAIPIEQDKQEDLNQIATDPFIALCQWLCEILTPVMAQSNHDLVTPSAPPMTQSDNSSLLPSAPIMTALNQEDSSLNLPGNSIAHNPNTLTHSTATQIEENKSETPKNTEITSTIDPDEITQTFLMDLLQ